MPRANFALRSGDPEVGLASDGRARNLEWFRPADAVSLRIIDADFAQRLYGGVVFDKLGDRLFAHDLADAADHLDHGAVDRIVEHVLDEPAVDLEVVHRKILQIAERRHAAAESSSENRQPSRCSTLMKRAALLRLPIALVSVISKQIIAGGML